eukprot:GEMP01047169.1.p1 GENE.GEMP01047169.1~~GEMP01047169.1.p1  ORF type:complete len:304 (+),score=22.55 GEMP01047169.1:106-912(+)
MFLSMLPRIDHHLWIFLLFQFQVIFLLQCASFYKCNMPDPGVVAPNWGFYNAWKPDRTRHCSICNRCILNMDHHCPWINNCVGFYNRKFFIQLLLYVYFCLWIVVLTSLYDIFIRVQTIAYLISHHPGIMPGRPYGRHVQLDWTYPIVFASFLLSVLLVCTLTNFIRFHMKLVMDNYTTIENLEREEGAKSKFDIGSRRDWEQVFGSCWQLWWFPAHLASTRPVGDGVRWRVHYSRVVDEDEELPADEDGAGARRMFHGASDSAAHHR